MVIDLYAAAVLEATGNTNLPQSSWDGVALFLPQSQRVKVKKNGWFDLLEEHSSHRIYMEAIQQNPEKYVLLFRALHCGDLERNGNLKRASYIYSQWEGYWGSDSFEDVQNWLKKHGVPKQSIHTSGHAGPADLQKLAAVLKPKTVVPIHSFEPARYKELFENVEIHADGETWSV